MRLPQILAIAALPFLNGCETTKSNVRIAEDAGIRQLPQTQATEKLHQPPTRPATPPPPQIQPPPAPPKLQLLPPVKLPPPKLPIHKVYKEPGIPKDPRDDVYNNMSSHNLC